MVDLIFNKNIVPIEAWSNSQPSVEVNEFLTRLQGVLTHATLSKEECKHAPTYKVPNYVHTFEIANYVKLVITPKLNKKVKVFPENNLAEAYFESPENATGLRGHSLPDSKTIGLFPPHSLIGTYGLCVSREHPSEDYIPEERAVKRLNRKAATIMATSIAEVLKQYMPGRKITIQPNPDRVLIDDKLIAYTATRATKDFTHGNDEFIRLANSGMFSLCWDYSIEDEQYKDSNFSMHAMTTGIVDEIDKPPTKEVLANMIHAKYVELFEELETQLASFTEEETNEPLQPSES